MDKIIDTTNNTTEKIGLGITLMIGFLYCIILLFILAVFFCIGYIGYNFFYKYSVNIIGTNSTLTPGKPYLISTTNVPGHSEKCIEGVSYGINDNGDFYIDKGCSGIFVYQPQNSTTKKLGVCTTNDITLKTFSTIDRMHPDLYPNPSNQTGSLSDPLYILPTLDTIPNYSSLTGFIDMTDENLSILEQNGNCRPGNYGFYGNNKIIVRNGCRGTFVLGPMIGRCGNLADGTSTNDEKICSIGSLGTDGDGLILGEMKPYDTSTYCNQGDKYGFKDINYAFRNPEACRVGGVRFGQYNVNCDAETDYCPLNANLLKLEEKI